VILLVDNYDSFTWNLVQQLAGLRNDALDVEGFLALGARAVVLGAGPGRPRQAGVTLELLARLPPALPVLGVCLGHEALVEHEGGQLEVDPLPVHGRASPVRHDGSTLFTGLDSPFEAGRYHSLRARRATLPGTLAISAWTDDGLVMAVQHRTLPRFGVQFHPESVLTPQGTRLMANFLALAQARSQSTS
jgi:anthranilate synthase/aminodeoxychorismate synthase-like glutamine amidotransferase